MFTTRDDRGNITGVRVLPLIAPVTLLLASPFLLLGSWFTVSPGYMGVITRAGSVQDATYEEGFHFKLPVGK